MNRMQYRITFRLRTIGKILALSAGSILAASLAMSVVNYFARTSDLSLPTKQIVNQIFYKFYVGVEYNVPTYYASFTLLIAAGQLAFIGYLERQRQAGNERYWFLLAFVLAGMSLDEYLTIHEALNGLLHQWLPQFQSFPFLWVFLAVVFVALLVIWLGRFWRTLPKSSRQLLALAGIVFVLGALGTEAVEGIYISKFGEANLAYELLNYVEEGLEMVGVAILIYGLAAYTKFLLGDSPLVTSISD